MNEGEDYALDRRAVRRAFDAAGADYDRAAVLQAEVRRRLLERLDWMKIEPKVVLDLGCGTGHASRALHQRYPRAQVVAIDLAFGMLATARRQQGFWRKGFDRICADAYRLPLKTASVDLVFSNLMLQWCQPPDLVFAEMRRVLKPQGLLSFSSFGPDTLKELRAAWAAVDRYSHVNAFMDMHDVGDALVRSQLAEPVLDVEHFSLTYDEVLQLMRELKAIGARNATHGRPQGLTGRATLRAVTAAYEQFRSAGKLPATYEVVYGHAWAPLNTPAARAGEVAIPLSRIGRRKA